MLLPLQINQSPKQQYINILRRLLENIEILSTQSFEMSDFPSDTFVERVMNELKSNQPLYMFMCELELPPGYGPDMDDNDQQVIIMKAFSEYILAVNESFLVFKFEKKVIDGEEILIVQVGTEEYQIDGEAYDVPIDPIGSLAWKNIQADVGKSIWDKLKLLFKDQKEEIMQITPFVSRTKTSFFTLLFSEKHPARRTRM